LAGRKPANRAFLLFLQILKEVIGNQKAEEAGINPTPSASRFSG
jgi:hypothetical protein